MDHFKDKIKEILTGVIYYEENEQERYIRFTVENQIIKFKTFSDLSKLLGTAHISLTGESQFVDFKYVGTHFGIKASNMIFPEIVENNETKDI